MICLILPLGSKHLLYMLSGEFSCQTTCSLLPSASLISCSPIILLRGVLKAGNKLCIKHFLKTGFLNILLHFHSHSYPEV